MTLQQLRSLKGELSDCFEPVLQWQSAFGSLKQSKFALSSVFSGKKSAETKVSQKDKQSRVKQSTRTYSAASLYDKYYGQNLVKPMVRQQLKQQHEDSQMSNYQVQSRSRDLVDKMKAEGRYTPIHEDSIQRHFQKLLSLKYAQELAEEELKQAELKSLRTRQVGSWADFNNFLKRNQNWCERLKQKQIERAVAAMDELEEEDRDTRKGSGKSKGQRVEGSRRLRMQAIREQLEETPFRVSMAQSTLKRKKTIQFSAAVQSLLCRNDLH